MDVERGCNILKSLGASAGLEKSQQHSRQRSSGSGKLLGRTAKSEVIVIGSFGFHATERDPELGLTQDAAFVWKNRIREAASEPCWWTNKARKRSSSRLLLLHRVDDGHRPLEQKRDALSICCRNNMHDSTDLTQESIICFQGV